MNEYKIIFIEKPEEMLESHYREQLSYLSYLGSYIGLSFNAVVHDNSDYCFCCDADFAERVLRALNILNGLDEKQGLCNWVCNWKWNADGFYDADCGGAHSFTNDYSLKENNFVYCPKCGRKINLTPEEKENDNS